MTTDNEPLYDEAVQLVRNTGNATISHLQRKLRIGYNRTARIIKSMEKVGVVGPLKSDGGRDVISNLFYLQDSRSFVGNDLMFWAIDGKGYTSDLRKAHMFTKQEAVQHHEHRETDIPWPKEYIDQHTRPAVDHQYVDIDIALKKSGITLKQPEKPTKESFKCCSCGRFVSRAIYYSTVYQGEPCPNCI